MAAVVLLLQPVGANAYERRSSKTPPFTCPTSYAPSRDLLSVGCRADADADAGTATQGGKTNDHPVFSSEPQKL